MSGRRFTFEVLTLDEEEREPVIVRAENKTEARGVAMDAVRKRGERPVIESGGFIVVYGDRP